MQAATGSPDVIATRWFTKMGMSVLATTVHAHVIEPIANVTQRDANPVNIREFPVFTIISKQCLIPCQM